MQQHYFLCQTLFENEQDTKHKALSSRFYPKYPIAPCKLWLQSKFHGIQGTIALSSLVKKTRKGWYQFNDNYWNSNVNNMTKAIWWRPALTGFSTLGERLSLPHKIKEKN